MDVKLPPTLTVTEVMELLGGVSKRTIQRYRESGALEAIKINDRRFLYTADSVLDLLRGRESGK